jgi:hypothetical protein
MKKIFLLSLIVSGVLIFSCSKKDTVPPYTPPVSANFSITSLKHTQDTVNVGDTIYLTATGTMYDTISTQDNIYTYLTVSSSGSGVSVYNYGSAAAPIKLSKTIGADSAGLFAWTATIALPGATFIANTKLTITANFIYQLTLSSEQGKLSATDAGIKNKTVFVQ